MHIRKLELQGFKSFVDRQTFHFGTDIAGVVGPNGCGKSNIIDAIRWCIGEQSAKSLRGGAMQDIIFNGSSVRKPVGMAEVTITFSAGDQPFPSEFLRFQEVSVGRRLYRDGTSEYLLNQTRVRRRDVVDFFLDTGVGNDLYSFIQQGQIGRIVAARPLERRSLIEEAAGISKYKVRRAEAETKLESTAVNLDRASDVTEEMARRLRTLERQVNKAFRYRRLRARLRQGELFLGLVKYAGLSADRRDFTTQLREKKGEGERLGRDLERRGGELKLKREELAVVEAVVTQLRDQLAELEAQRREQESARRFQHREREELVRAMDVATHDSEEASQQQAQAARECEQGSEELKQAKGLLADQETALGERQRRSSELGQAHLRHRNLVEQLKAQVMKQITGLARQRAELSSGARRRQELEEAVDSLAQQEQKLQGELSELLLSVQAAQAALEEQQQAHTDATQAVGPARQVVQQGEAGLRSARAAVGRAENALKVGEREHARTETQVQSLVDLQQAHSGVEGGARKAVKHPSAIGTLAEQLDVPEELELPLTAALGVALDHVLLRDGDALPTLANQLRRDGRTGLVPVGPPPEQRAGLLAQVSGTPAGLSALHTLLGDCALCDDLPQALATHASSGGMAVTRAGEVVQRSGVVLVGLPQAATGAAILKRRRRLVKLRVQLDEHAAKVDTLKAEVVAAQSRMQEQDGALEASRRALATLQARSQKTQLAFGEARLNLRDHQRVHQGCERRIAELAKQRASRIKRLEGLTDQQKTLAEQVARGESIQAAAEEKLKHAQAEFVTIEDELSKARELLAGAQSERGAVRERVALLERSFKASSTRKQESERRLLRATAQIKRCEERQLALVKEQQDSAQAVERLATEQGKVADRLGIERQRLQQEREATRQLEEKLGELRTRVERIKHSTSQLELKLQEVRLGIATLREQTEERYQISLPGLLDKLERDAALILEAGEEAQAPAPIPGMTFEPVQDLRLTPELVQSPEAVRGWVDEIEVLRAKLAKLGEVNLAALEEYQEVYERHAWLEQQRDDLQESVDTIRRTIARINRVCRERFRETFDQVNRNFHEIYPRLAGGGKARLSLTNEEDLLETGVDIFVQPPGKRLQNLSLLSGGEKALCAIGLIFSLFKVKPSPFCLLDEVDAPLDEGNGARFNDVLREMSSLTQFIVITHNKKTMEAVDTLYGITMPEPGVSRLVTVRVT